MAVRLPEATCRQVLANLVHGCGARAGLFQDRGPRGGVPADRRAGHVGGGSLGVVLWSRVWPARGPMADATYRGPRRKAGSRFLKPPCGARASR